MMKKFNAVKLQEKLFSFVQQQIPKHSNLAIELCELLQIKKSAAYKRISGIQELSFSELQKIGQKYRVSIDQFLLPTHASLPFASDAMRKMPESYADYLKNINKNLAILVRQKEVRFAYLANELPFFHFMLFPELFYFKLFVWNQSTWNFSSSPTFQVKSFQKQPEIQEEMNKMLGHYYAFGGVEIWPVQIFDSTFKQLKFYVSTAAFDSKEDIIMLLGQLKKLKKHLRQMANAGTKFYPNESDDSKIELRLYYNEMVDTNNTILFQSDRLNVCYTSLDVPNFLQCADAGFCSYVENWLIKVKKKSALISREGERDRSVYFRIIDRKFEQAEKELLGIMENLY